MELKTKADKTVVVEKHEEGLYMASWYSLRTVDDTPLEEVEATIGRSVGPVACEYYNDNQGRVHGWFRRCAPVTADGYILLVISDWEIRRRLIRLLGKERGDISIVSAEGYWDALHLFERRRFKYAFVAPFAQVDKPHFGDQKALEKFLIKTGTKVISFRSAPEKLEQLRKFAIKFHPDIRAEEQRLTSGLTKGEDILKVWKEKIWPLVDQQLDKIPLEPGLSALLDVDRFDDRNIVVALQQ